MKTLTLTVELRYDAGLMHGKDVSAQCWFNSEILGGDLLLHSNDMGDTVGDVKVLEVRDKKTIVWKRKS